MAWSAARKLRRVLDNVRRILAVEYVIAARAIELRDADPARATGALVELLRTKVPGAGPDRYLSPELRDAEQLLASESLETALRNVGVDLR